MEKKVYPRYDIRVPQELCDKLKELGTERVREHLMLLVGQRGVAGSSPAAQSPAHRDTSPIPSWSKGSVGEAVVDTGYWRDPAPTPSALLQRVKVFSQTPEQREEKLKMLAGMKLMPQMAPKAEFYPDDEPNEENT